MKITKFLALLLVVCMAVAVFASCGETVTDDPVEMTDPYAGKDHATASKELYNAVLGEFKSFYDKAADAETVSERFALMAIAEAKLLESGVMLPSTANGGNYAISRILPYTVTPTLWGNDSDRYHQALIVNGDPLTPAERDELKALWKTCTTSEAWEAAAKAWVADKGYTLNRTYTLGYTADPTTWDALDSYQSADSEAIVNTYDGLIEYDLKGNVSMALATGYTVSEDGMTYTFTIRQGVKWTDVQGNVLGEVKAQDFVNGMRHMMDAQAGLEYLIDGIIVGASDYMAKNTTDFSTVGVKATDDYTLVYTLEAPCTYFDTMFGYNVFAPLCTSYFTAQGGVFGVDELAAAKKSDTYTYGTSYDKIAYCGPYLVTSATENNSIVFGVNPNYWNKDNINIDKIVWKMFDAQNDPNQIYNGMKTGEYAGAGLSSAPLQSAKTDKLNDGTDATWFSKFAYVSGTDAGSYPAFHNLYRQQYANYNDATIAVSGLTETERVRANLAMQNQHFRLALCYGLDRGAYNAAVVGDELKYTSMVNSYAPGNFVQLAEEVTVKINDKDTKFAAGTYYGAIMQAQITADGYKMKVWDPTLEGGVGSSAGYDGWYNVTEAVAQLELAITELKAQGVEISAENPIKLDMPYYDTYTVYANRAQVYKQSIEQSLGGKVIINLVKTGGQGANNWYRAGYYPTTGDDMNYNIFDGCGWGPDYGDPATYLDTMLPQGGGMAKNLGLY